MVHAMSYPIAMKKHLPHGLACSLLLPFVMEFNLVGNPAKFSRIAELMGEKVEGLSIMDRAKKSIDGVRRLSLDVGLPQSLSQVGFEKANIPEIVEQLFSVRPLQARGREANPRDMTKDDARRILEAAMG